MIKKIGALIMAAALALSLFAACGEKESQYVIAPKTTIEVDGQSIQVPYVFKIGEYEVSLDEYRYYFMKLYESMSGGDYTVWQDPSNLEALKLYTEDYIKEDYALRLLADEYGVELSQDSIDGINASFEEQREEYRDTSGGDSVLKGIMRSNYFTDEVLYEQNVIQSLMYALYNDLYGAEGHYALGSEELATYAAENYVRARHILVTVSDFTDEAEVAEKRALIESILEEINAGADFEELLAQYDEDPGQAANPQGYYFTYGEMVEPFETAAFALEEGGVSGIVETSYGFHIIHRLPLEESYIASFTTQPHRYNEFLELIRLKKEEISIEYADNFEAITLDALVNYYKD